MQPTLSITVAAEVYISKKALNLNFKTISIKYINLFQAARGEKRKMISRWSGLDSKKQNVITALNENSL